MGVRQVKRLRVCMHHLPPKSTLSVKGLESQKENVKLSLNKEETLTCI